MCGIAGIVDFAAPAEIHRSTLERMVRRLRHRGPDGERVDVEGAVALGHTQLAIRDPARSAQPMRSRDGRYVLVYNGELYDDAAKPGDWAFASDGDTEIVLAACARFGVDALPRFDGMFALFFWDERERRGFLARDLLGVKPLFFARRAHGLAFASEPRALLEALDARRLSLHAALAHWTLPCFGGVAESLFDEIEVLPPGHALHVDECGLRLERWARFVPAAERAIDLREEAQLIDDARAALTSSVRGAARPVGAHAPFGILLSGGLDSSAVAAIAAPLHEALPAYVLRAPFVEGASILSGSHDGPFADEVARALGLRRVDVPCDPTELPALLARVSVEDGCLPAFEQQLSQARLFAAAADDGARVVLVGDAADETWFGYAFLFDTVTCAGPAGFLERFGARRRLALARRELVADLDPYGAAVETHRAIAAEAGCAWDGGLASIRATSALIVARWLPRLLWNGDVHAMARGIEARVPFAGRRLLDVAARVPASLGIRDGVEKHALRRAVPDAVPARIRWRPKSALPKDPRAGAAYRAAVEAALIDGPPLVWELLDRDAVRQLVTAPAPLDEIDRAILFGVATLSAFVASHALEALAT